MDKETFTKNQLVEDGKEVIEYLCKTYGKDKLILVGHSWGTNKEFNLFNDVKKVDIPVYFCARRYDYATPSVLVEKYYEELKAQHKEFIWFENSAHFPQYTENDKFCDLLLNISNKI